MRKLAKITKIIAIFFSVYFTLFSSISYSYSPKDVGGIPIPASLGRVSGSHFSGKSPLVVHIQDAHGQSAAQRNISKILKYLVEREGFRTLFLEGGLEGNISPDLLRFFRDEKVNQEIADQLLEEGRIGGPDEFLLESGSKVRAYGLETAGLYRSNLEAFREVLSRKKESDVFLEALKTGITSSSSRHANPQLHKFLKEWVLFQDQRSEIIPHLDELERAASKYLKLNLRETKRQFDWPQLVRYFSIKDLESQCRRDDFKAKVAKESKRLSAWLSAQKMDPAYSAMFESLANYSFSPVESSFPVDIRSFLEAFYEEAKPKGFSFSQYYYFMRYLGLLLLGQELVPEALFEEIKRLSDEILERLARTTEESSLTRLARDYVLVKKLFSLELTRAEYAEILQKEKIISPEMLVSRLASVQSDSPSPYPLPQGGEGTLFRQALRFYSLAEERENAMFGNLLRALDKRPAEKIILVTGGFHTSGLASLMKDEGFSFIEVTPKIASLESSLRPPSPGTIALPVMASRVGAGYARYHREGLESAIRSVVGARTFAPGPGFREQSLEPAGKSLGAREITDRLLAQYTRPVAPPREIVSDPEHYQAGPHRWRDFPDYLPTHFRSYLSLALRGLPAERHREAQQALTQLLSRGELQDLTFREAEEIVYEFTRSLASDHEPMRFLKELGYEAATRELRLLALEFQGRSDSHERGLWSLACAVAGNQVTSATFHEKAVRGLPALEEYAKGLFRSPPLALDHREELLNRLEGSPKQVLYFLDNVMEDVFDLGLVRWLLEQGHYVTLVAKSQEADNDVILKDLELLLAQPLVRDFLGLPRVLARLRMIASGSASRGTNLRRATPELVEAWKRADIILSKGEGNRGTLVGVNKDVFHLFVAKSVEESPAHLKKGSGVVELVRAAGASPGSKSGASLGDAVDRSEIQRTIFQHINGLVLIPTMQVFSQRGVFELFGTREVPEEVGLEDIAKIFNPNPEKNSGNVYGALRSLALQGWVRMKGKDEKTSFRLTEAGRIAAALAKENFFQDAVIAIQNLKHYHEYFRGPPGENEEALEQFEALVSLAKSGWGLPEFQDPKAKRVVSQIRRHLDGMILAPVLVALGMPLFEENHRVIDEKAPSIWSLPSLNLAMLPPSYHPDFLETAFDLLAHHGMAVLEGPDGEAVRLTARGAAFREMVVSYGVTNAYLKSYAVLEKILAADPEVVHLGKDSLLDRIMDIWGASGSHVPYLGRGKPEGLLPMIKKIFDQPLELEPKGIADMGCGDGKLLREIVEFIIQHTERGKHLKTHPLFVVAADYSPSSVGRAAANLEPLEKVSGVYVEVISGDVTNPARYDSDIRGAFEKRGVRGIGARDFLHTQMFLPHERQLVVKTREEAMRILHEHVLRAKGENPEALKQALGLREFAESNEELVQQVADRFTVSYSDQGRLVPAVVAAADLIQFAGRWTQFSPKGLIILDLHTPGSEEMFEELPEDSASVMKIEKLAAPAYWGTHWIFQYLMPHPEHNLAFFLAGLVPSDWVRYPGAKSHLPIIISLAHYQPSQSAPVATASPGSGSGASLGSVKDTARAVAGGIVRSAVTEISREAGPAVQAFNRDFSFVLKYLESNVRGFSASHRTESVPLVFFHEEFGEAWAGPETARKVAQVMEKGDLFLGVWPGFHKPPLLNELVKLAQEKFKVSDIPQSVVSSLRILNEIESYPIPPVSVSSVSERGDLEIAIEGLDRVKLNLEVLSEKGFDPVQVMALIRKVADDPGHRREIFDELFSFEAGYWEAGQKFAAVLERIYAQSLGAQELSRAA